MELDKKIYDLIKRLEGTIHKEAGIITATFPNGEVWDFTVPMRNESKEKELKKS